MSSIAENIAAVKRRMADACARAGRNPAEVKLVAVSKMVPLDRIAEGARAGLKILGENYVQEALEKIRALDEPGISWHFIGHLQSNKAKMVVEGFDLVHTVDRRSLAKELDRRARQHGRILPVLLQVNVGQEETKSGTSSEELGSLFQYVSSLDALRVRGLMTLPPFLDDPQEVRPYFRHLRHLLEQLREKASSPEDLTELSMGMSHDFEVAIEEGATLIRVGTALFGSRPT
ncbi:YggS family pyridoxal phosphate-dependent enzyme [Desulfoferrobacter suflitae]|uniref:YggS family pyridoxal phosphate-dependent enzyme n=1 Tax=Desulfoferrobacter suflitae TaxID=2865782 RepID=UPI002164ED7B|nr:YggS family pyridoxal phosphate-dependent enzyme [Desulfoferrobacter suflitae]MCK8602264.1 YggS family pyridoxal phosphate-dependent enzyme [Desulfoferrobacter suflitae]